MAESVSSYVKRIVDKSPFIHEMLISGILSYSNYADAIQPEVEKLCGAKVKNAAIVMALRRYAEELKGREKEQKGGNVDYQIVMKTNIFDLNLVRRDSFIAKLGPLYSQISPEKGIFLTFLWEAMKFLSPYRRNTVLWWNSFPRGRIFSTGWRILWLSPWCSPAISFRRRASYTRRCAVWLGKRSMS